MQRILPLLLISVWSCGPKSETASITLSDIKLTDLSGQPIDFSQYKDKVVLINFWATWCRPCLQEMPTLANAQRQLKEEPIVFLFASNETLEQIDRFRSRQSFDFQYVHLTNLEALNILALPTTFIFNPKGERVFAEAGYRQWDSNESLTLIANLLKSHD